MRVTPSLLIALAAVAVLSSSCQSFRDSLLGTGQESPVDESESYLNYGGPRASVDVGQGGEHLLSRFQSVLEEKNQLEEREAVHLVEIDSLQTQLRQERAELERERRLRAGADAQLERLRQIKSERELKILHLHMELAKLQRSKLQLELAGVERQVERLNAEAGTPAMPPGGNR